MYLLLHSHALSFSTFSNHDLVISDKPARSRVERHSPTFLREIKPTDSLKYVSINLKLHILLCQMCSWRLACMSRCSWVCKHARRDNTQCSRYLSLSAPVVYPLSVRTRCLSFLYFLPRSHRKSVRIVLNVVIVY